MSCCILFLPLQTAGDRLPARYGVWSMEHEQYRKAFLFIYKKVHFSSSWDYRLDTLNSALTPVSLLPRCRALGEQFFGLRCCSIELHIIVIHITAVLNDKCLRFCLLLCCHKLHSFKKEIQTSFFYIKVFIFLFSEFGSFRSYQCWIDHESVIVHKMLSCYFSALLPVRRV